MSAKILLILGSGGNIGASTASKFAANGFKVALAARSLVTGTSPEGYHTFKFDAADPSSVKSTFEAVRAALGTPNVVLFNAAAHIPNADPFGVPLEEFTKSLNINTTSAYAAAGEALKGLDALKLAGEDLTFLYTGNGLNTVKPFASTLVLGVGKSASAHFIKIGANEFGPKGAKFYYVDERTSDGGVAGGKISGPAHAAEFFKLAGDREQHEAIYTFVAGKGYVAF